MRVRKRGRKRAVKEGLARNGDDGGGGGMTFKWEEGTKGKKEKAEGREGGYTQHKLQLRKRSDKAKQSNAMRGSFKIRFLSLHPPVNPPDLQICFSALLTKAVKLSCG